MLENKGDIDNYSGIVTNVYIVSIGRSEIARCNYAVIANTVEGAVKLARDASQLGSEVFEVKLVFQGAIVG